MRIKQLLLMAVALPLLFTACKPDNPVDEVKEPTVTITAGTASASHIVFTVASTDAEKVAYVMIYAKDADTAPIASEVLASGTLLEPNKSHEIKMNNLDADTEYLIIAAAQNKKGAVKASASMKTTDGTSSEWELTSDAEMEFAAEGGEGVITYTYTSSEPDNGAIADRATDVDIECEAEWIEVEESLQVGEDIRFTVAANDGEARETTIVVKYVSNTVFEVKVKQTAKAEAPAPDADVVFTASVLNIDYYGTDFSAAYNYYICLSDVGLNDSGHFKQDGNYYLIDLYSAESVENAGGCIPNGTYKLATNYAAGTFSEGDYGANVVVVGGVPDYNLYTGGTVVVSDDKIEANLLMEDGTKHYAVYNGSLKFADVDDPNNPVGPVDIQLEATSWNWGGSSSYGNKYAVAGEGFSLDVHFPAKYATQFALEAGDYIWTNTSWWGYNDFENEFTTRSFLVDGAYSSIIKEGTAVVEVTGEEYAIELVLKSDDGTTYTITYNGKLADSSQGGGNDDGEAVVFTACETATYNSAYYFYEFKLSNEAGDKLSLCVNDYQAKADFIYTDDTYEWISLSYCGNLGFFSTRNIVVGGTSYTANAGGMVVTTDEATKKMDITITLDMTSGDKKVFTFSGIAGEDNGGNDGGETPVEPTPLATPNVSAAVEGNSATISWDAVAGAANYTVTLGSSVETVTTTSVVFSGLDYATTYSVSVVANPTDTTANTASAAGTASFTTDADPDAGGGDEGGSEGGDTTSYENWVFTANVSSFAPNSTITFTDGSHTVTCKFNQIAEYIYAGDTSGFSYAYDFTVDGEAVALENVSGTIRLSFVDYKMTLDLVIDGVKYTGTSTNAVA